MSDPMASSAWGQRDNFSLIFQAWIEIRGGKCKAHSNYCPQQKQWATRYSKVLQLLKAGTEKD